jgi:preprotein translocase subunit SecA
LIVYKEKAFEKFEELMFEIEYKTTKSIFSIKANIEIKQMEFNENNFIITNDEESLHITQKKNTTNPLFLRPVQNNINPPTNDIKEEKKKMRI